MKKFLSLTTLLLLIISCVFPKSIIADATPEISAPSAILMDYGSGEILYEKNADDRRALASVTKIMTLLITMEEIYSGNLKYDDIVTGSEYAKSFGGSTIFLDAGEQMTVSDIIKGIAVASGNDASVAIAEHISGSEDVFVSRMNDKAKKLGMDNTNFVNCNGLDADGHYSTARDIAKMSRELMKYEDIFKYTGIWMDSLRNGEFTLSNTNKLIRFYDGATGLKTGSTNNAMFCISATAKRDNMHLIAVIMGAETSKKRQADASELLNYGFSNYNVNLVVDKNSCAKRIDVKKGIKDSVEIYPKEDVSYISLKNSDDKITTTVKLQKNKKAPVLIGDKAGTLVINVNGNEYKRTDLVYGESVDKITFKFQAEKYIKGWIC